MAEKTALEQIVGELFARGHIQRYLLRNLNPEAAGTTPYAHELSRGIAEILGFRVKISAKELSDAMRHRGKLSLVIAGDHLPHIDRRTHDKIMDLVEGQFNDEFHRFMDQLHYGPAHVSKQVAMETFRNQYDITEEEYPMRSMQRNYQRYEEEQGRIRRSGKPRRHPRKEGTADGQEQRA